MLFFNSLVISLLAAATTLVYAQHALKIVRPVDQEYLQIGGTFPVELQAPSTGAPAKAQAHAQAKRPSPGIQLAICTEITGFPLCNHTMGVVLLTASFRPPSQTYHVTIPTHQSPGLSRLLAGHVIQVNGTVTWTSETSIEVYLGGRI